MGILKGDVEILGLGNLLQTLAMNRREGELTMFAGMDKKSIYFGSGEITRPSPVSYPSSVKSARVISHSGSISSPVNGRIPSFKLIRGRSRRANNGGVSHLST